MANDEYKLFGFPIIEVEDSELPDISSMKFGYKKSRRYRMHPKAYGLTEKERQTLVSMAKSGCYYETYLSGYFNISVTAVRDICAKIGMWVCQRIISGSHVVGYDLNEKIEVDKISKHMIHRTSS